MLPPDLGQAAHLAAQDGFVLDIHFHLGVEEELDLHRALGDTQQALLRLEAEVGFHVGYIGIRGFQLETGEKEKERRPLQLKVPVPPAQPGLCIGPYKNKREKVQLCLGNPTSRHRAQTIRSAISLLPHQIFSFPPLKSLIKRNELTLKGKQ